MSKKPFEGKVRVSERLKSLIPALDAEQKRVLEQSILEEGRAYSPLWLWGDVLVDGHHRYEICTRHRLPYETMQVYEGAATLDDVEYRMKRDAIGQRNLPPAVQSKFRAEMVAYHVSKGKGNKESARLVAKESNVSMRQVQRDVARKKLVDQVAEPVKPATDAMSTSSIKRLAQMSKSEQKAIAKQVEGDGKKLDKEIKKMDAPPVTKEEQAKKLKSLAHQHRDKLVRLIDDYGQVKKNQSEQIRLVRLVQSVQLW